MRGKDGRDDLTLVCSRLIRGDAFAGGAIAVLRLSTVS